MSRCHSARDGITNGYTRCFWSTRTPPLRAMANSADGLDKSLLARLVGEPDTLDGSCHVAFRFRGMYHLDVCESTSFHISSDPRRDVDE